MFLFFTDSEIPILLLASKTILYCFRNFHCRRRLWWEKILLFCFFLSDYFILGLRIFDRVLFEEVFDLFGSSVVGSLRQRKMWRAELLRSKTSGESYWHKCWTLNWDKYPALSNLVEEI